MVSLAGGRSGAGACHGLLIIQAGSIGGFASSLNAGHIEGRGMRGFHIFHGVVRATPCATRCLYCRSSCEVVVRGLVGPCWEAFWRASGQLRLGSAVCEVNIRVV